MDLTKVKKHLSEYKVEVLKITGNGKYWKNHKEYSHILPLDKKNENIINSSMKEDLISLLDEDSIHLGFHHLNSSQALALNLFGPLVIKKHLEMIDEMNILGKPTGIFEYVENQTEYTNFDFFVTDGNNKNYFEVKYTENNFGNAKPDKEHKQKFNEVYKKDLESISDISEKEFYEEYQLWRNILYSKKGNVFFTLPDFRIDLINKVETTKSKMLSEELKERIHVLSMDSLVRKCKVIEELRDHYIEFENKYLDLV